MNYFFIPQRQGLLPPASSFRQLLHLRWPQAQVEEVLNPTGIHALEFSIAMAHSRVYGSLNRAGDSVVFVGDIRDCAEFALWCRSIIPPGKSATFCDESMSGNLDLDVSTTLADILKTFAEQPETQ